MCILKRCFAKDQCISQLLRCLFFYSAYYNFEYSAVHIPGNMNIVAEAISRNNMIVRSSLAPQVSQTAVRGNISNFLLQQAPDWGSTSWIQLFTSTLLLA